MWTCKRNYQQHKHTLHYKAKNWTDGCLAKLPRACGDQVTSIRPPTSCSTRTGASTLPPSLGGIKNYNDGDFNLPACDDVRICMKGPKFGGGCCLHHQGSDI